jgi:ribosomal protein S18 acetylase RimI-like enzyme
MEIIEVKEFSNEYLDAINRLICYLVPEPLQFMETDLRKLLASGNNHLFLLKDDNRIAGMLTICIYRSPTGTKAWIEDVVVDEVYRGRGFGRMLTQHAIDFAKSKDVDVLMLTSNPARMAANKLYQTIGFERKDTNVYRIMLKEDPFTSFQG